MHYNATPRTRYVEPMTQSCAAFAGSHKQFRQQGRMSSSECRFELDSGRDVRRFSPVIRPDLRRAVQLADDPFKIVRRLEVDDDLAFVLRRQFDFDGGAEPVAELISQAQDVRR